ncbi:MAG: sulfide/dihydroorotate dehydrogenase-like FAD/NAD-binding protein [Spirochaetales bacterium]|nr:sulfide/dihydroorotate dehydrogenase-like FAD/NAD-binding protein [Spirochaetales bacterium]
MYKIIEKTQLADKIYRMEIEAPDIVKNRKPGQFIILQVEETYGERIPLTMADANPEKGTITIIFQTVGQTTLLLEKKEAGDLLPHLLGPLGKPTHIRKVGTVVCVGGGIGIAPLYPIARAMKEIGNRVIVINGARSRDLVILKDEIDAFADEQIVCTDDGSFGRKGVVTIPLKELCEQGNIDEVIAIGPPIMMKFCAATTLPYKVPTVVSLNTIMVDGTGMCGGCRVTVGGQTKFVCVDGPEFDGHQVDFENMMLRLGAYKEHEEKAAHKCKINSR